MKGATKKLLAWGVPLLIFAFILGCGVAWVTNEPAYTNGNPHHCKKDDERPVCESLWERTSDDPVAFFTFWLVVVTAGLVGGALIQMYFLIRADETARIASKTAERAARATEDTVLKMDETAERQLRAYVLVEKAKVENAGIGLIPTVEVTMKNFGQTPAYDVTVWSTMGFDLYPAKLVPPVVESDANMGRTSLGPGAQFAAYPSLGRPLTSEQLTARSLRQAAIYVVGHIRYVDAFGKCRTTEFFLFSGGPIGTVGNMAAYTHGNKAT